MSNAHENGELDDVQAVVHVEPELSLYSYWTDATPLPRCRPAVEASVTEPPRFAAGAVIVTVGSVLSTRRAVTGAEVPVRPTLSVAIARKS